MSTTTIPASQRVAPRRGRGPRLGPRVRKAVLVVHVLAAGTWVGVDVLVGVLVLVGRTSDDPSIAGLAYRALGTFVLAPMLAAALVCLVTGLLLGLATKWGLTRYWWVLVKLVITLVLTALIVLALAPGMPDAVLHGQQLEAGVTPTGDVADLVFPPIVSLTALSVATVLSVYKPWGRVRDR